MSLKYRDSQGAETPVAGLNGTRGELVPSVALQQSGTTDAKFVAAGSKVDYQVTFTTAMPDTNYQIVANTNGVNGGITYSVWNKSVTGFSMTAVNNNATDLSIALNWTAFKLMTDTVHEADSAYIAQNTANFAPTFSEVTSYAVGDYVTYNSVLYRCTTAHTAGVWVAGHFTQVTVGDDLEELRKGGIVVANGLTQGANTFSMSAITNVFGINFVGLLTLSDRRNAEIGAVYFAVMVSSSVGLLRSITSNRATLSVSGSTFTYNDSAGLSSANIGKVTAFKLASF